MNSKACTIGIERSFSVWKKSCLGETTGLVPLSAGSTHPTRPARACAGGLKWRHRKVAVEARHPTKWTRHVSLQHLGLCQQLKRCIGWASTDHPLGCQPRCTPIARRVIHPGGRLWRACGGPARGLKERFDCFSGSGTAAHSATLSDSDVMERLVRGAWHGMECWTDFVGLNQSSLRMHESGCSTLFWFCPAWNLHQGHGSEPLQ